MSRKHKYIVVGKCEIHPSAQINNGAIIGKLYRRLLDDSHEKPMLTKISKNTYIGYYTIIGNGSNIGKNTIIDDCCHIESHVSIGKNNLFIYSAQICNDVIIGQNCVIGGLIGERTKIGNNCRIFGKIVHSQFDPSEAWDNEESMESSPVILDSVFIGFGAIVVGNVKIGPRAYICAGSVISKNVPPGFVANGFNRLIHHSKCINNLKTSKFFQN